MSRIGLLTVAGTRLLPVVAALFVIALALGGCRTAYPLRTGDQVERAEDIPPDSARVHSIYLIGDAGAPHYPGAAEVLSLLDSLLAAEGERASVIFLGDNIYPSGMPPPSNPMREDAEARIDAQLDVVADHPGRVIFIPGNHDWGGGGLGGDPGAVSRQEAYVESRLGAGNTFLPDRSLPGPIDVQVRDDVVVVVIDTQWWLEDHRPYGNTGTYELELEGEFLLELDDLLWRHADKHRIVVGHHPLFTNGEHGGFYRGVRSLWTGERLARGYLGTPQDLSNLKYRRLKEALLAIFQNHRDLVYAAGHEHSLQYFNHNDQHYVVSGSGSKMGHVEPGHGAMFVKETKGFAALQYYTDGSIWIRFYEPGEQGGAEVLFTHRITDPYQQLVAYAEVDSVAYGPSVDSSAVMRSSSDSLAAGADLPIPWTGVVSDAESAAAEDQRSGRVDPPESPYDLITSGYVHVAANPAYGRGKLKKTFLGEHYRDVWAMEVPVPVIDLERTAGGLTPIQKGGGLQTMSLRLVGGDGDQYVLRSIDKDPTQTIPEYLRETIAHDVVQDQIAAMHPYGAFMIPQLAEAAGIYHTSPTLVYVPDHPALGFYRPIFGGMLALFESRPDEDQSDEARFGYAENVIGTPKLIEEIENDNDERVDQRAWLRARLFDMMIGDWDRHADQWRWSEFDVTPGKIYKPIPRDRDFAFFKFDGFLPNLVKKSGNVRFRRFTNFFMPYDDVLGLNLNGASMDRRFTSSLQRRDWIEIADSIKSAVTDAVIDHAVLDLPEPVFEYHGRLMAALLKLRRDRLPEVASEYYDLLSAHIDIVGSDKHERFEVIRMSEDSTLVILYKAKKEGDIDRELYRRTIYTSETKEVRLYGLGGNDRFHITGSVRRGPRIRAIGGADEDTFVDSSSVSGMKRRTIFHDSVSGNEWTISKETRVERSDDPVNNSYAMMRFEIDESRPLFHISRNRDDGFLLGGGYKIVTNAFRKQPYGAQHRFLGTAATSRRAYNARYRGHYLDSFRSWDGELQLDLLADRRYENFYGIGNDTELGDRAFYRARIGRITVAPSIADHPFPFTTVRFGPHFDMMQVEPPLDLSPIPTRFDATDFVDKYFVGVHAEFDVDGTDTLAATEHGARWLNSLSANVGVRNTDRAFVRLTSEFSYFYTFHTRMPVTVALRFGGATNVGGFEFYQASMLGGQTNLRGYRRTRFAGRTAAFSNIDVRVHLTDFNVYLIRGLAGVLVFVDHGRVWSEGDGRLLGGWHRGYGGGIWVAPFNKLAFAATIGRSKENTLFDLTFGFQF